MTDLWSDEVCKAFDEYTHHVPGRRRWGLAAFGYGWLAARRGGSPADNPYRDVRTADGKTTFARGYRKRWFLGFDAYREVHGHAE